MKNTLSALTLGALLLLTSCERFYHIGMTNRLNDAVKITAISFNRYKGENDTITKTILPSDTSLVFSRILIGYASPKKMLGKEYSSVKIECGNKRVLLDKPAPINKLYEYSRPIKHIDYNSIFVVDESIWYFNSIAGQ